ncbi:MAG: antibiotic biosynthesis monooxygenase [Chloroflexota bacterium]|nr:antibiotic biosynthesis monooxygenase [Chloroflexota bacterium]MDE2941801.1 antibiotic biosynthesis monooxygenase [Chloroflexota bacterium]MDE3267621.1 antibiotic biosynthesis monooxygenase [Chloroflexota bacterium]
MTFVTRREGIVPVRNIGDYLAWSERVSEFLQAQPGFQGSFILNSLAHLDKYTSLTLWDSRQAWRAAIQSTALVSFLKANSTTGMFTANGSGLGYEVVLEIDGPGRAGVVNLNDFIVDVDGAVPAFIESRRVYWEGAREGDPRFVRRLLLRELGSFNRFVGFTLHTEFAPPGERGGSWRPPARSNFTTLPFTAEQFEIVLQV